MKKITIRREAEGRIKSGYLWIHKSWIKEMENVEPAEEVEVVSETGKFLGCAYVNPDSLIAARIYSRKKTPLTKELIVQKIERAFQLRKKLAINSNAFKVFFSESDGLPGLLADLYDDVLVFQIVTLGLEKRKSDVISALNEVIQPAAIVERKDAPGRLLEGLDHGDPVFIKGSDKLIDGRFVLIEENGIIFKVDVLKGHKTGHYLDQRENRKKVGLLAEGKKVLDCFCNTGGFGIYCAKNRAEEVTGIDISEQILQLAAENARLNKVDHLISFVKGNVFDELRVLEKRGRKFDMVILDPPSFTKSKKTLPNAIRGYKEINLRAIKLLKPGGLLVTASCSHHVTLEIFMKTVFSALRDTKREGKIVDISFQAPDHPILFSMPETLYLKLLIVEVW